MEGVVKVRVYGRKAETYTLTPPPLTGVNGSMKHRRLAIRWLTNIILTFVLFFFCRAHNFTNCLQNVENMMKKRRGLIKFAR
jgi:hypothetical protein